MEQVESEALRVFGRDRDRSFVESLDVVSRPFIERLAGRRRIGRIARGDRQALAVIVAERFEHEEALAEAVDTSKGFFERLVDWLSDPANRQKIVEIIEWFMSLLDMFAGMGVQAMGVKSKAGPDCPLYIEWSGGDRYRVRSRAEDGIVLEFSYPMPFA